MTTMQATAALTTGMVVEAVNRALAASGKPAQKYRRVEYLLRQHAVPPVGRVGFMKLWPADTGVGVLGLR